MFFKNPIAVEKITVQKMILLYCKLEHKHKHLCNSCQILTDYALSRLDHCHFGLEKPVCLNCMVHCYKPIQREAIRKIMRFSGRRMIWYYPGLSIVHLYRTFRSHNRVIGHAKGQN